MYSPPQVLELKVMLMTRDCHGFINPCGLWVRVGAGAGAGWNFSTLRKPAPASTGSGFVAGLSRVIYIYILLIL